jgi:CheY-like chemotaxis protein
MKDRILVVEDDFVNMISALVAFQGYSEVEDNIVVGVYEDVLQKIEEFKPTIALLDVNIKGGGSGTDIGKILKGKGIPYVYVSGIDAKSAGSHLVIIAIGIKMETGSGELRIVERFETREKGPEIWRRAYEILKGK